MRLRVVECGEPDAPPALLLHGWACSAYSFANLMQPLAASGMRAVVLELPGHALSDKPLDPRQYTLDAMTQVVVDAAASLGIARCAIVGHSMGTAVALAMARQAPDMVARLVLASPLGLDSIRITAASKLVSPDLVRRLLPAAVPRALVKASLRAVHGRRHPPSERDVDMYWAPTAFPEFGYAMVALLRHFEWRAWADEVLAAIAMPTLLVCGVQDPLVRHDIVRRRAPLMRAARVLALEGVGHVPIAEAPDEVVPAIVEFIRRG